MPLLLYDTVRETLIALIVVLPIALLRWWSETGFTRGVNGQGILLCLLPLLFIVGPTLLSLRGITRAPTLLLVTGITLSLLVGFAEEGMFRGVIMRCLLPKGIWPAVLFSTFCFAGVHLTHLLSGASWGYTADQVILALGAGVLLASLRIRTAPRRPRCYRSDLSGYVSSIRFICSINCCPYAQYASLPDLFFHCPGSPASWADCSI